MSALSSRDRSILEGIVQNCASIESRIARYSIDAAVFRENADYREMILFPLVQIGELANHLSSDFLAGHDELPWKDIVGMRHVVVHGYGTIDCDWAWNTLSKDIVPLRKACESYLSER